MKKHHDLSPKKITLLLLIATLTCLPHIETYTTFNLHQKITVEGILLENNSTRRGKSVTILTASNKKYTAPCETAPEICLNLHSRRIGVVEAEVIMTSWMGRYLFLSVKNAESALVDPSRQVARYKIFHERKILLDCLFSIVVIIAGYFLLTKKGAK